MLTYRDRLRLGVNGTTLRYVREMKTKLESGTYEAENANLEKSTFTKVTLQGSTFNDVNLKGAVFENVALTGATIRNACLGDLSIEDAGYQGMQIEGILVTELLETHRAANPTD